MRLMKRMWLALTLALLGTVAGCGSSEDDSPPSSNPAGKYTPVNGMQMYYEESGQGEPLVVLNGGLCTIASCVGPLLPSWAKTRRVIAVEQQAHGHTNDIDRPMTYDHMAEDVVVLLERLGIAKADFFGYSDGGIVALRLGIRHPNVIRRMVTLSAYHDNRALQPGLLEQMEQLTPEALPPSMRDEYAKVAPDPSKWPVLVEKVKRLGLDFQGFPDSEMRTIPVPVLIVMGDHDIMTAPYGEELSRLLPNAQLAVLPGADHFSIATHAETILSKSTAFLDAP
ncbi:alpha/beta hydrolase [Pendulispora rubella]|uniref:Alpha/beta hydrolase n=1 Tax=Pendulispora rubella TaxID=2741070 RepID=A0ABZ2KXF3_9BACT